MKIKIKSVMIDNELKIEWREFKNKLLKNIDCCEFMILMTIISVIVIHLFIMHNFKHPKIETKFETIKLLQDEKITSLKK